MRTVYLDIFSGVSGDMFLGALIDLGVDLHALEHELAKLKLTGYHLHVARQMKAQISGVKFVVHLESEHHHKDSDHTHEHHEHAQEDAREHQHEHDHGRHHHEHASHHEHEEEHEHGRTFAEIKKLISASALSAWVKQKSIAVFQRIAVAEGRIHGKPPEQVHFHEVGALDSIVDIVGACVALEQLGKPRLLAAPVVEGTGWIDCAHGRFPIPAPATLEILSARGISVSQCAEPHELVTPTGAALLAEFVEAFGPMREFVPAKIGYGLGTRENQTRPNVLRAVLGESAGPRENQTNDWETDAIVTLQTNLDDISSEILGRFVEQALAAGALDVFYTAIQMKKNRPGILLSVLCMEAEADRFSELILRETTAFGVRRAAAERRKLRREVVTVKSEFGEVSVKLGRLNGKIVQVAPEFDSCRRLADQLRVPLKQIYEAAVRAFHF